MSVEEHLQEASRERQEAAEARSYYDPRARVQELDGESLDRESSSPEMFHTYNPTTKYLDLADRHLRYAQEHVKAAEALKHFEEQECTQFAPEVRAACPLVTGAVTRVEETKSGVRLYLKKGSEGASLVAQMRCHLAFARARGFKKTASCPLYLKGVSIELVREGTAIEIRSRDPQTSGQVREQARELFTSEQFEYKVL